MSKKENLVENRNNAPAMSVLNEKKEYEAGFMMLRWKEKLSHLK